MLIIYSKQKREEVRRHMDTMKKMDIILTIISTVVIVFKAVIKIIGYIGKLNGQHG
jgi:hypothetical protein